MTLPTGSELLADDVELVRTLVDGRAGEWDLAGRLPEDVLRTLGGRGLLCTQVPRQYGGRGLSSEQTGEFTASVGALCSSLRSVMTSVGMAAWTIERFGDLGQRRRYLGELAGGRLAAVGFSEPDAGSDLAGMTTTVHDDGDHIVLSGEKVWTTAASYADLLVIVARYADGAAAVVVPSDAPGVRVTKVPDPMGCRAAGHANIRLDGVRLPAANLLGATARPVMMLVTTALAYGRMSVAWGCVGILRACLESAAAHAGTRKQFGQPLAEHQLVARHLAELYAAERTSTYACLEASRSWDSRSPDMVLAAVLAKHVSARHAAEGASAAVQVLASAGSQDGHVVARAYRDAKMMEIIEGSTEICQLLLAQHAVAAHG
ncbi:acyl-CoA dehydrogenase family protein [Hamadaea sp.]|uniref:acyl-CoA dehydrogenase family protein n=1 Tax=Hamadaea sp. TaxID=2024425 RepID=UPI0025C05628|nr:acyl-CoA dehydrogenase family protein [Hamadaea sp.]